MRATTGTPPRTASRTAGTALPAAAAEQPPAHAVLIVVAVAAGAVAQGGYYPIGRILVCALAVAAADVAGWTARRGTGPATRVRDRGRWLLVAATALGLWTVLRAALAALPPHGTGEAVLPGLAALATLAGFVAVPVAARRLSAPHREWLAGAVLAVGALIAVSAWAGVAWRLSRFAIRVAVTPTQQAFKKGVAFGQAVIQVCDFGCQNVTDAHDIQIVKPWQPPSRSNRQAVAPAPAAATC